MSKGNTLVVLGLAGLLGCNTPKPEWQSAVQSHLQAIHEAEPAQEIPEQTAEDLSLEHLPPIQRYHALAEKQRQTAEVAERLAALAEEEGRFPTWTDDGFYYTTTIKRYRDKFFYDSYTIEFHMIFSAEPAAKESMNELMAKGLDKGVAESFLSTLTISIKKLGETERFFVDKGMDGLCDLALIDGITYSRKIFYNPVFAQCRQEIPASCAVIGCVVGALFPLRSDGPARLTSAEIQKAYEHALGQTQWAHERGKQ